MAKGSKTVVYSAMGANAVIAAAKFAVGLLTGSAAMLAEAAHSLLKTALYKDAAATTGVLIAALGLFLVQVTGNPIFDGLASVVIGIILIYVAFMLGREARDLLLGSAAPRRVRRAIREAMEEFPEVRRVVTVPTMQLGPDSILVTGELNIRDDLSTDEMEDLMARVSERIREAVPQVRNIYLEPHTIADVGERWTRDAPVRA